jgi:hypothetical protein
MEVKVVAVVVVEVLKHDVVHSARMQAFTWQETRLVGVAEQLWLTLL